MVCRLLARPHLAPSARLLDCPATTAHVKERYVSLRDRQADSLTCAAAINAFPWVFYAFGLILLITAGNMLKPRGGQDESVDNTMVRAAKGLVHTSDRYDGDKLFTVQNGKRAMTPMLLVIVAIAGTDLLFALDSIRRATTRPSSAAKQPPTPGQPLPHRSTAGSEPDP